MIKVDLHVHTVPTASDNNFVFDLEKLKEYVLTREIDGIAITNHNQFDLTQFQQISEALPITVLPGIEIDLEGGHILLIADSNEISDFTARCMEISKAIRTQNDFIEVSELIRIFPDMSRYILIPHYDKKPAIKEETFEKLRKLVTAGEVTSPKKFIYCIKHPESLVPVYFSDTRITQTLSSFSTRQTYIAAGQASFAAIKMCLSDKNKVFLSKKDGHQFFDVLDNGLRLSTGLNVILGERSSGKSHTLEEIYKNYDNVKYIRQFELLERDEESDISRFNSLLNQRQSLLTQDYLRELQNVVESVVNVDLQKSEHLVEQYLSSLIKNAKESERADSFSKAMLFNETDFSETGSDGLKSLIGAVTTLIENHEYRSIIDKHIPLVGLKNLAVELMKKHTEETELRLKKRWLNDLISSIRKALQMHTAATAIDDVDFYLIAMERKKIEKFKEVVQAARKERVILKKEVQGFQIVAKMKPFGGAMELKNLSGKKIAFSEAFQFYDDPYHYLNALRGINGLAEAEYFKFFACIEYRILNKHGFVVSGGERSEFRLLQEINEAQHFDMLLIDEPESSFDNLFLKNDVNGLIREISKSVPVVIVTHNNTVGASIKPDFVVYTKRVVEASEVIYRIYTGLPSDKFLAGLDGQKIKNLEVILNCLEAGHSAYVERGGTYEMLKD